MKRRSTGRGDYPNDDNGADEEDLISQLPDEILILIISLIPTKTAITTSILSKRWRNVYKFMSIFDLDHHDLSQCTYHSPCCELIIDRMERLLSLCSHSKIEFFLLRSCSKKLDQNKFEQCIHHLGKSGIEHLMVHLSCRESYNYDSLPCHFLLELPSLKELLLKSCSPQPNVNIKFESLSVLYLETCNIVADFVDCILSNCLSLHSLLLSYCKCPPKLSFRGSNIGLKNLEIFNCEGASEIELYAKNITKFECLGKHGVKFDWVYVPGLETVFFPNDRVAFMHEVFTKLPKYAPSIKELSFCIAGGFFQERTSPIETITFGGLRRLDITVFCKSRTNLQELTPYLESYPLLEELYLNLSGMNDDDVGVQDMSDTVLYRKLKFVEMSGFRGKENEIQFALYILKSAVALEKMWITRCFEY